MQIASWTLFKNILAKVTSKKIETHFKSVLPLFAKDEAPACVIGHLTKPKNPVQRIRGKFVKQNTQFFISEKLIDLIVCFFSYKYQFMDVNRTAS